MEETALGELGLTIDYFYSLTPRQFANTVNGRRKRDDNESKERWMIARKIMYFSIVLKTKNLKEKDIINFPWEDSKEFEFSIEDQEKLLDEVESVKAFYEDQDKKEKAALDI
jgi:hypothetical protein